jgi:hypothetical protein
MADKNTETCAHPSCNCPPAEDSDYCSALCEGNEGRVDIICACGHPICAMVTSAAGGERYVD